MKHCIFASNCALMLALLLAVVCNACRAGEITEHTFGPDPKSMALYHEIDQADKNKDYGRMEAKSREYIAMAPLDGSGYYNLACAQALQGKKDDAFASLHKSLDCHYSDAAHAKTDSDLKNLHADKQWADIEKKLAENAVVAENNARQRDARMQMRINLYNKKDYTAALQSCDDVMKLSTDDCEAYYYKARSFAMMKKNEDAFTALDKAVDVWDGKLAVFDLASLKADTFLTGLKKGQALRRRALESSSEVEIIAARTDAPRFQAGQPAWNRARPEKSIIAASRSRSVNSGQQTAVE